MYTFERNRHMPNCSFKPMQCIYWDFSTYNPLTCLDTDTPKQIAFRKRKTHSMPTIARIFHAIWQVLALKRAPYHRFFYLTFQITALWGKPQKIEKILCLVLFLGNHLKCIFLSQTPAVKVFLGRRVTEWKKMTIQGTGRVFGVQDGRNLTSIVYVFNPW